MAGLITGQVSCSNAIRVAVIGAGVWGATARTAFRPGEPPPIQARAGRRALELARHIITVGYCGKVVAMSWYGGSFDSLSLSGRIPPQPAADHLLPSRRGQPELGPLWNLARRKQLTNQLLAQLNSAPLLTHTIPIEKASEAYEPVDARPEDLIQAVLSYAGSDTVLNSPHRPTLEATTRHRHHIEGPSMIELSPCLELLFTEAGADIGDRVRAAHAAGYRAGEIWSWRDKNLDSLEQALTDTGLTLQTLCTDPMTRIVDPNTHAGFLAGLEESVNLAERLHSPYLVVTAGDERPGIPRSEQRTAVVDALTQAAELLSGHPVTLLLENLNSRVDHVGTFFDSTAEVAGVLREVNHPQVKLLYDAYHSLVMQEDPQQILGANMDLLRHIQIADAPGRHQPGSGTHDWAELLHLFSRLGYRGRIGLEYRPTGDTVSSLTQIRAIANAA